MEATSEVRRTWSPNVAARIAVLLFGIALLVVFFIATGTEPFGRILLLLAAMISIYYGFTGLIRRPRFEITDENMIIRRTFRDHVYPRYAIHGFRMERPIGLFRRAGFLTIDIARVEDWSDLGREFAKTQTLPTSLPPLKDRERDILEVLTFSDLGISSSKVVPDLEAHGMRNLSKPVED
ncbi:MAG: hypothetical protein WAN89_04225 [Lawsonella sp.]